MDTLACIQRTNNSFRLFFAQCPSQVTFKESGRTNILMASSILFPFQQLILLLKPMGSVLGLVYFNATIITYLQKTPFLNGS